MKISVITATYNSAATLGDTIESVLAQTYGDIEYIIVDGVSTDGTLDIIRQAEPRFGGRLRWVSEPDHGLYDAMNKGIRMATGDVVGILNSDDFYYDNRVVADIADAFADGRTDCIFGDLIFVAAADTGRIVREWKGSPYRPGAFLRGWHPAHPTFYARRTCYERFGGFDTDIAISADFDLMLRFIEKNGIATRYLPRNFILMRTGGESTGSLRRILLGNKNIKRALRKNGYRVPPFYTLRRWTPKLWNLIKMKIRHPFGCNKKTLRA